MTRSAQALIWSVEGFKDPRLWTFTVAQEQDARITAAMWRRLAAELKRSLGFCGIRVFEMHPGGHGLHVHVVAEKYFNVRDVRFIAKRMGWGRLHVERIKGVGNSRNVAYYVAKYLSKFRDMRKEHGLKGMRVWAAFGGWKNYCRVAQVEVESTVSRLIGLLSAEEVTDFWGKVRCRNRQLLNFWRFKLALAIWGGRLGDAYEEKLSWALAPAF